MSENLALKRASTWIGGLLVLIGVLSLIPGITTGLYGELDFAGQGSTAELVGLFQTSWLLILSYLVLGVAGIAAGRSAAAARSFLYGAGVLFLAAWVYGLAVSATSAANFVPFNTADDWLHLVIGGVAVVLAYAVGREAERPAPTPAAHH